MAMTDSLERESRSPQWRLDIESDDIIPTKNRNLRWLRNWLWPSSKPSTESSSSNTSTAKQLRRTAYLDGLRGFAAFLVYIHHHELWVHASTGYYSFFESAYGWEGSRYFVTLPIVRNFITGGHSAVAVFYVISGYVLSAKPLALLQAGEHLKMADNLGSAFFRRWFRLYLPLLVTTFVYITSWHLFGVWNAACEPKDTYWEELANWIDEWRFFAFLFREHIVPWVSSNTHLWSIPLEMRGSVVTFCALLALSRSTTRMRLWSYVALIVYFIYFADGYYCALFIAGMLQCDLDLLAGREETEGSDDDDGLPDWIRRLEPYGSVIFYHMFFVGMLLAGVPSLSNKVEDLRKNPGWYWLSYLKPCAMKDYKWFFLFWAANMIVASVPRLPWLKRFFETRFCQYLGRISFALYLVHGPILAVLGDRIYFAVGWVRHMEPVQTKLAGWINLFPLPKTGPLGMEIAFLVPNLFLLPFTLWVADFVTRTVDDPSVKFARWLHEQTLAPKKESRPQEVMRLA